jgi:dCMP deaminase
MPVALILYAPVLHQGYLELFRRQTEADHCYLLGDTLIAELAWGGRREIREVPPEMMVAVIQAIGPWQSGDISLLDPDVAHSLTQVPRLQVIMPNLEICRRFADRYLGDLEVTWDTVFLQWDEGSVMSQTVVSADHILSTEEFDRRMIALTRTNAESSSCWWRRVGAVLVRDGEILMATHNRHVPTEQVQYIAGDPRDFVVAGTDSYLATTLHSEQAVITRAAREGIVLEGCELYVPVFPCPMCAKQIAYSGIRKLYFTEGHASLDGESILRSQGIEIVLVQ